MDVYGIVTEKVLAMLESGTAPWRRPWASVGMPRNLVSKKPYRGINVFLLGATKYVSPYWLTYKQAAELGGTVRKGEKSNELENLLNCRHCDCDHFHYAIADNTAAA